VSVTTLEGTEYYTVRDDDDDDPVLVHHPSGSDVDTWREGYPYDYRMSRSEYEEQKRLLQIELLKLQKWSQTNGLRHVIVFEGRDASTTCLPPASRFCSTGPGTTGRVSSG
jgi:polyphosphate kinase 2 (PPK2 family)